MILNRKFEKLQDESKSKITLRFCKSLRFLKRVKRETYEISLDNLNNAPLQALICSLRPCQSGGLISEIARATHRRATDRILK